MYGIAYKDHIRRPSSPNRLACFIPFKEGEERKGVVPDLSTSSSTRRYTSIQGYSRSKQFYSPDYSHTTPTAKDYRRTLLWNPRVKPIDGKLIVEFYNSSNCDAIAVNIEGRAGDTFYSNDETMPSRVGKGDDRKKTNNVNVRYEQQKDSVFGHNAMKFLPRRKSTIAKRSIAKDSQPTLNLRSMATLQRHIA